METTSNTPLMGPIQLVVVGFPPDAQFRGEIIRALSEIRGRGVVRLLDALFVRKDATGRINTSIHESDLSFEEREALGAVVGGLLGLLAGGDARSAEAGAALAVESIANDAFGFGIADLQNVKDKIQPGQSALVLLIEHQWALDLKGAVRGAGGVPIIQGFLTPEALFMVGAELRAVIEAEDTIALAQAVEGAAVLSALATVVAADMVQQAAAAETARVLIAAGLIEEAAVQDVINTLVAAELIKQDALAEAQAAVDQANNELAETKSAQALTNGQVA
ncbi:MAG: hypothetical protein JO057_20890 [Chloroflexi bacterium]|nr:hypothetical protein [Chloroflexota bacterium]